MECDNLTCMIMQATVTDNLPILLIQAVQLPVLPVKKNDNKIRLGLGGWVKVRVRVRGSVMVKVRVWVH